MRINTYLIEDINLMIFDKDGTLMDLYNYWSRMVDCRVSIAQRELSFDESYKRDIMYAMGVDLENYRLRPEGPVGLKKREVVLQAMIDSLERLGFRDTYKICLKAFKEADELSIEYLSDLIKPISGMHRLIDFLYKARCKIAIATTDKTDRAHLAMEFLGINDKIDIVVGEDAVKNYKPFPDMVSLILKKLSIDKENSIMVGDALTDIEMGINAGLKASVGVCSGLTLREELLEKTRYVVNDVSEIEIV